MNNKYYYVPYLIIAIICTTLLIVVALLILAYYKRRNGKKCIPEENKIIYTYPKVLPNLNLTSTSQIQPLSPTSTPTLRKKRGGLLDRRGSNASLTINLEIASSMKNQRKISTPDSYLITSSCPLNFIELSNSITEIDKLSKQFWEIPSNHQDRIIVAGSGVKNRYKTIIPNETTRVKLSEDSEDILSSYINANYIRYEEDSKSVFIATQGPLSHTIIDFWKMVWETNSTIIVMITKLKEKDKSKCELYLNNEKYGDYNVTINNVEIFPGYELRTVNLEHKNERRTIIHYWYTAWPDHKTPEQARHLVEFILDLRQRLDNFTAPIIVHCSAGIGRTGCFIGTYFGIEQILKENKVDILSIVCRMRLQRGGMVQTNEQYEFIHQAINVFVREFLELNR